MVMSINKAELGTQVQSPRPDFGRRKLLNVLSELTDGKFLRSRNPKEAIAKALPQRGNRLIAMRLGQWQDPKHLTKGRTELLLSSYDSLPIGCFMVIYLTFAIAKKRLRVYCHLADP